MCKFKNSLKINGITLTIVALIIIALSFFIKTYLMPTATYQYIILSLLYEILVAIVASIIFFIIVVYIPQNIERNHIKSFISKKSWNVVGDAKYIYSEMAKASGVSENFYLASDKDIDQLCNALTLRGQSPMLLGLLSGYADWLFFLMERRNRSVSFIEKLLRYMNFLKARHIQLLTDILDSAYFWQLEAYYNLFKSYPQISFDSESSNKSLSILSLQLKEYFRLAKKLDSYLKTEGFTSS